MSEAKRFRFQSGDKASLFATPDRGCPLDKQPAAFVQPAFHRSCHLVGWRLQRDVAQLRIAIKPPNRKLRELKKPIESAWLAAPAALLEPRFGVFHERATLVRETDERGEQLQRTQQGVVAVRAPPVGLPEGILAGTFALRQKT